MSLEPLEFEPPSDDQCCALCNPFSVADFETKCVAVRRAGGNRVHVCLPCVDSLCSASQRRTVVTSNKRDLDRWAALEGKAPR